RLIHRAGHRARNAVGAGADQHDIAGYRGGQVGDVAAVGSDADVGRRPLVVGGEVERVGAVVAGVGAEQLDGGIGQDAAIVALELAVAGRRRVVRDGDAIEGGGDRRRTQRLEGAHEVHRGVAVPRQAGQGERRLCTEGGTAERRGGDRR